MKEGLIRIIQFGSKRQVDSNPAAIVQVRNKVIQRYCRGTMWRQLMLKLDRLRDVVIRGRRAGERDCRDRAGVCR